MDDPTGNWRFSILRIYWDGQEQLFRRAPGGDFFAMGWASTRSSPHWPSASTLEAPSTATGKAASRKHCRITMTNIADDDMVLYYQINYTLTDAPGLRLLHAQFRRVNPLPYKSVYTILEGVQSGQGEIKFYLDGDLPGGVVGRHVKEHGGDCFPTVCGTGTEDYFCGSYNFENRTLRQYQPFTTPYTGLHQVIKPDGVYRSQQRFGMYRWHITDPVRFQHDLRVTIQALGWSSGGRYLPLQDDIASVAYWYQTLPTAPFPELPVRTVLEVI